MQIGRRRTFFLSLVGLLVMGLLAGGWLLSSRKTPTVTNHDAAPTPSNFVNASATSPAPASGDVKSQAIQIAPAGKPKEPLTSRPISDTLQPKLAPRSVHLVAIKVLDSNSQFTASDLFHTLRGLGWDPRPPQLVNPNEVPLRGIRIESMETDEDDPLRLLANWLNEQGFFTKVQQKSPQNVIYFGSL